jgi:catechol 2,3-dioxygenase-like lactoylglutathione lyase family enzyme
VIHHVQLAAPPGSEPDARAFWVELLGFVEIEKPPALAERGGCWFRGDGIEVHVGIEDEFQPAAKAHPGFLVHNLDELCRRLAGAGSPVTWDERFPGMRRFYSEDPFGNRLEFLEALVG